MLLCEVYLLRDHLGKRLPGVRVEEIGPVRGFLLFEERFRRFTAYLFQAADKRAYVLTPLERACVKTINGEGLLIVGTEITSRGSKPNSRTFGHRQSWWCVPSAASQWKVRV